MEPAFELNASGQVSEVELRFSAKVAPFISELIWHPSQRVSKKNSDGSITLTMRVAINEEIVRWILGYGSECAVIRPAVLIDMLKNHLYSLKQYYNI
ncbi:MAG: WYL domain-containing protein [Caldisericia bacterium]